MVFTDAIIHTPFTLSQDEQLFSDYFFINYNDFVLDNSFIATARALLIPRNTRGYHYSIQRYNTSAFNISEVIHDCPRQKSIVINSITGTCAEDTIAELAKLENFDEFYWMPSGLQRQKKLELYYKKYMQAVVFIQSESQIAMVYVKDLNMAKFHAIQSMLPQLLPKVFKEQPILDQEKLLLKSLTLTQSGRYIALLQELEQTYQIRRQAIMQQLERVESYQYTRKLKQEQTNIRDIDCEIEALFDRIQVNYRKKDDVNLKVYALEKKIQSIGEQGGSELTDYFSCNTSLEFQYFGSSYFDFVYKGYVTYYDADIAEAIIDNLKGRLYPADNEIRNCELKQLYQAVFLKRSIKIRVCAAFRLDFQSFKLKPLEKYVFPETYHNYLPNPHLDYYTCLGNNEGVIQKHMGNYDYIAAIEQAGAATRNLNFADSTVLGTFASQINDNTYPCFELPDGSCCNTNQAIAWLNDLEKIKESAE